MEKFYVTTPIYYVNDIPSLGSAYTTIAADILSRWNSVNGKSVRFVTGLDENSSKTIQSAEKAKQVSFGVRKNKKCLKTSML